MKIKILSIIVFVMILLCGNLVNAYTRDIEEGKSTHTKFNSYNDWREYDCWVDDYNDGGNDAAFVDETGGECIAESKVGPGVLGEQFGKAGFCGKSYITVPVTAPDVSIGYTYTVKFTVQYSSSYSAGDWAEGHIKANISLYEDNELIRKHTYNQFPSGHGPWDVDGAFYCNKGQSNFPLSNNFVIDIDKDSEYYLLFEGEVYAACGRALGFGDVICKASLGLDLSQHKIEMSYVWKNRQPSTPSRPEGESRIELLDHPKDGVTCVYRTSATDPDGEHDLLEYDFRFSDSTSMIERTGYSGETVSVERHWDLEDIGEVTVQVRVRDSCGNYSDPEWSYPLRITVPRSKPAITNPVIKRVFESFPNFYLLFQRLLKI